MKITYAKVDGTSVEVEANAEYVAQNEKEVQWYQDQKAAEKAVEDKKNTDAKAGNDKLIELGLTQDQVTAMTGYTPPAEE